METIGADMTTHLANHVTMTETAEMTGGMTEEMTDVNGVTNEETIDTMTIEMIDTMDTDMTDAAGAIVTISGLGDNSV